MKFLLSCYFLMFTITSQLFSQDGWEWQNPLPTGHDLIYVKSFSPTSTIAIGNRGTLFKTHDGGENWITTQNSYYNFSRLQFFDENNGYALVDEPRKANDEGLFITSDGGENWIQIEEEFENQCSFYFINQDTGWVVGVDGYIMKTTDGCKTWIELTSIDEPYNNLFAVYFLNANKGFVAGNQVFMTEDGGSNWKKVEGLVDGWVNTIYFFNDQIGWIGGGESIIKTEDGGESWKLQATGGLDIYSFAFLNTNEGYAVGNGIYRTMDGGKNWKKQADGLLNSISFANNQVGWAVGRNGMIYKTFLFLGNKIWVKITKGTIENLNDIFFVDENNGWVVGTNGIILNTTNGGKDWNQQESGTTQELYSVHFIDEATGWIVGVETILYTTNYGFEWNKYEHQFEDDIRCVYFFDKKNGWICGDLDYILKTNDGGKSWEEVASSIRDIECVYFINDTVGWFCSYSRGMYKTRDGGYTLEEVSPTYECHSLFFLDSNLGWRCTGGFSMDMSSSAGGSILKTIDGCISWNSKLNGAYFKKIHFFDEYNGLAVGVGGGKGYIEGNFYKTSNGGENWESQLLIRGIHHHINDLYFIDNNNGWVVGAYGAILKTNTGGGFLSIPKEENIKIKQFWLSQNYPNPFNPSTTIEFTLPKSDYVELKVYNILGKEVANLVSDNLNQGNHTYQYDGKNLASGIYYYQLLAGDYREVKKMILLR